jgi:hypothetical protein
MNDLKGISLLKSPVDLRLRRIADVLHLNASFTRSLGLLDGKMGIAIFLYHYARKSGSEMYENYAGELIDEIYEEITPQTPVDFSNGLTGIGWGIEYLVENGFVEADTDEALKEIDDAIYSTMLQQPVLIKNTNDLFGYGFYCLARLRGNTSDDSNLSTLVKKQHLIYLTDECERLLIHKRYLDFNIMPMSIGTINSIAWFLLQMHKLNLFPTKVIRLLNHLPMDIEFSSIRSNDWAENFILWNIVQNIIPIINDTLLQQKYMEIVKPWFDKNIETNMDDETFVINFAAGAWQKLIYFPYIKDHGRLAQFFGKTFNIIDNEENWAERLDKLNNDNIGLTGLAGIGLGLLGIK